MVAVMSRNDEWNRGSLLHRPGYEEGNLHKKITPTQVASTARGAWPMERSVATVVPARVPADTRGVTGLI